MIEIDGDSHAEADQADYDVARTRWLEERGSRVIRFAADLVEEDLADVVNQVRTASEPEVKRGQRDG